MQSIENFQFEPNVSGQITNLIKGFSLETTPFLADKIESFSQFIRL